MTDPKYTHKVKYGSGYKVYPANAFSGWTDEDNYDPYDCATCEKNLSEPPDPCDYKPEKDGPLCPREIASGEVTYEEGNP